MGWLAAGFLIAAYGVGCPPARDRMPPGKVTGLVATEGDSEVGLDWDNPGDGDLAGVRVQRKAAQYPSSPTDGVTVYDGPGESCSDTGLANGTAYYYAAFAYDGGPNYAAAATAKATPVATTALVEVLQLYAETHERLELVPAGDRMPLEDALGDSETAYRNGETCQAAEVLRDTYLPAAQNLRVGKAQGMAEDLYNLGRMTRYLMLEGLGPNERCQSQGRVGREAAAVLEPGQSDNTQVAASFEFGEPKTLTAEGAGEVFTQVVLPGANGMPGTPGEPAIPTFRRLVAVPRGAEVVPEFTPRNAETFQAKVYPVQDPPVAWSYPGPTDPPVYGLPPFVKDDAAYAADTPYPEAPVTVTEMGESRGLRLVLVEVAAGHYNPVTEALTFYEGVDVHLAFRGGSGAFLTEEALNPFESRPELYVSAALNAASVLEYIEPSFREYFNVGEELMILTHSKFEVAADRLAQWKNDNGLITRVFVVNDGAGSGPDTAEEIDDFIEDRFNTMQIRPSYALLLGDAEHIPTFYNTHPSNPAPEARIASDFDYANVSQIFFDVFCDLGVGRISVDYDHEAEVAVDKIIAYESNPPNVQRFYQTVGVASQFQCCRNWDDLGYLWHMNVGREQVPFVEYSEFVVNTVRNHGKTADRLYRRTIDPGDPNAEPPRPPYVEDPTPRRYYYGAHLPPELRPSSGFQWNASTADVLNALNEGRFLVTHADHGNAHGWENPAFDSDHVVYALGNYDRLPMIFSMNCSSGFFDNETDDNPGTHEHAVYFVEYLLRLPDRGAIGIIASTRAANTESLHLLRGLVDAIWPNALPDFGGGASHRRLGDILNHGRLHLITEVNHSMSAPGAGYHMRSYNAFGDPSLELWLSNPHPVAFPGEPVVALTGAEITVAFETDGATITATQRTAPGETTPLGRARVAGGRAVLILMDEPEPDEPIQLAISYPGAFTATREFDPNAAP